LRPSLPIADPADFQARFQRLRDAVGVVVFGQGAVVDAVLATLVAGGHALLEGLPGLGKTVLVKAVAQALRLQFQRVQCTPDLMPADILGTWILLDDPQGGRRMEWRPGPVFTQILLADEVNRATPKTQSALLEAMAEHAVTTGGQRHPLGPPFFVLATQNPLEMEGTYPLPEAQLDRFMAKVLVPYPSLDELDRIVLATTSGAAPTVEPVLDGPELLAMQSAVRDVEVAAPVRRFAMRLVLGTHPEGPHGTTAARSLVRVGASPRGAQAVLQLARVAALLRGDGQVGFADVRWAAPLAFRHRLLRSYEAERDELSADAVVERVLAEVPELEGPAARLAGASQGPRG
jgi:MoxR-like ATPase